jgi:glycosyltransferase involved in cell wall biosynthesis
MNILVVTPLFYPTNAGYSNAVTNFVTTLGAQPGIQVSVVVLEKGADLQDGPHAGTKRLPGAGDWIPVKLLRHLVSQLAMARQLRRHLVRNTYDLIFVETVENPMVIWWAIARVPALANKTILRIHATQETEHFLDLDTLFFRFSRFFARRLIRAIPNIAATTRYYIDFVKRRYLNDNVFSTFKNYAVIPNVAFAQPGDAAAGPGDDSGKVRIFLLGRMNRAGYVQKNFELFAQALYLLKARAPDVYARIAVTLVGDGDMAEGFSRMLAELDIADAFTLVKALPNLQVRAMQKSADFVAVVSRYEGQSMFALEALMQGAPLIAGRGTGLDPLVDHGRNGFLVDPDDPQALCDILMAAPGCDRTAMRAASLAKAEAFSPDRTARRFLEFAALVRASRKAG